MLKLQECASTVFFSLRSYNIIFSNLKRRQIFIMVMFWSVNLHKYLSMFLICQKLLLPKANTCNVWTWNWTLEISIGIKGQLWKDTRCEIFGYTGFSEDILYLSWFLQAFSCELMTCIMHKFILLMIDPLHEVEFILLITSTGKLTSIVLVSSTLI